MLDHAPARLLVLYKLLQVRYCYNILHTSIGFVEGLFLLVYCAQNDEGSSFHFCTKNSSLLSYMIRDSIHFHLQETWMS